MLEEHGIPQRRVHSLRRLPKVGLLFRSALLDGHHPMLKLDRSDESRNLLPLYHSFFHSYLVVIPIFRRRYES